MTINSVQQTNKNIPYYLAAVGIFILLKFGFAFADNNDLAFLLKPTDQFVGILTGSHSVYLSESGYFHDKLNVLIDKSCAGFNFWVLCFLMFTYLTLKYVQKPLHKTLIIPSALLGAYLLTIFVNASRIFVSIVVQNLTKNIFLNQQHLVHATVGIITNLSFLILTYYLVEKFLIHRSLYAKFS